MLTQTLAERDGQQFLYSCLRNMVGELVSKELLDLVEIEPSLDSLPPFDSASLGFLVVQAGFCGLLLQLRG